MRSFSAAAIDRLHQLRTFEGAPKEFWPALGTGLAELAGAARLWLLTRPAGGEAWGVLAVTEGAGGAVLSPTHLALAGAAAAEEVAAREEAGRTLVAVALRTGDGGRASVVLAELPGPPDAAERAARVQALRLVADVPASYRAHREHGRQRAERAGALTTLDVLTVVRDRATFQEAAFALTNELAQTFRCTQVGLGWLAGRYVRLRALSHRESFDRKSTVVQRIEAAMEEALDQDDELRWPAPDAVRVTHDLARCAAQLGARHLLVVPLRRGEAPLGALLLQRDDEPFAADELTALRVLADQVAEPLAERHRRARWWGARLRAEAEAWLRARWSLEHPGRKLGALAGLVLLVGIGVVPTTYRAEAVFVMRPSDQALIGAPFDGYLQAATVTPGDAVAAGAELFALDEGPLRLQEVSLRAEQGRHRAEAERARGEGRIAEMRIAQAQADQVGAELELVRHQLAAARAQAPFDGLVLDDADLRERVGAPVRRGDLLVRLARAGRFYAELDLPEHAIDAIGPGAPVALAFASRPDLTFAARVERVEPVAVAKEAGGVFVLRAEPGEALPEWVRPGMTGVAKVEVGPRTLAWRLTHRLVDWLRLKLWW